MNESTIAERLQLYFTNNGLSIAQVARDTGIQYDTLQQILYGRVRAMGVDKFAAIWQAYPDLDGWHILTGKHTVDPCAELSEKLDTIRNLLAK